MLVRNWGKAAVAAAAAVAAKEEAAAGEDRRIRIESAAREKRHMASGNYLGL